MNELIEYAGYDAIDTTLTKEQIIDIKWKFELSPDNLIEHVHTRIYTQLRFNHTE